MTRLLTLLLLILGTFLTTACVDTNIPQAVAEALALKDGGTVVMTLRNNYASGKSYHVFVCTTRETVQKVEVYGTATKPNLSQPIDTGLPCGSRSEFWKLYDEKAPRNPALKEELEKFTETFGLKNHD